MNSIPMARAGRPSWAISNISNLIVGSHSSASPATTRFVLVPIRVQVPPRIDAYDSGKSISETLKWQRRAQPVTRGTNIATTGVLLRNADSAATGNIMRSWPPASDRGRPSTTRAARSRPPVSFTPAATTNSAAIVTTAGFEKPVNASAGSMMPASSRIVTAAISTMSGPARFAAMTTTIPTITAIVIQPSPVIMLAETSSRRPD